MNAVTGTVFAVIIAFGWLMVIWWVVIMLLGMDIRKDIRNMGGKAPELKITSIIVTSLLNLMTVAVTLGYFYETYKKNNSRMCKNYIRNTRAKKS